MKYCFFSQNLSNTIKDKKIVIFYQIVFLLSFPNLIKIMNKLTPFKCVRVDRRVALHTHSLLCLFFIYSILCWFTHYCSSTLEAVYTQRLNAFFSFFFSQTHSQGHLFVDEWEENQLLFSEFLCSHLKFIFKHDIYICLFGKKIIISCVYFKEAMVTWNYKRASEWDWKWEWDWEWEWDK